MIPVGVQLTKWQCDKPRRFDAVARKSGRTRWTYARQAVGCKLVQSFRHHRFRARGQYRLGEGDRHILLRGLRRMSQSPAVLSPGSYSKYACACACSGRSARSGKTAALLVRYRRILATEPIGIALWLAPTKSAAGEIRERLLDNSLAGCFRPGVFTFQQFADLLLNQSGPSLRFVGQLLKRQVLQRVVAGLDRAGQLQYFAPIANKAGLVDLLAGLMSDLKRQEVWPDEFRRSVALLGPSEKNREIAAVYDQYQQLLNDHRLYDSEGRFWSARALLDQQATDRWGQFAILRHIVVDGFTDFTRTQHEILQLLASKMPPAGELTISLLAERETDRDELFLKSRQTLNELQSAAPEIATRLAAAVRDSRLAGACASGTATLRPSAKSIGRRQRRGGGDHCHGRAESGNRTGRTADQGIAGARRRGEGTSARSPRTNSGCVPQCRTGGGAGGRSVFRIWNSNRRRIGRAARAIAGVASAGCAGAARGGRLAVPPVAGGAQQQLFSAHLARMAGQPSGGQCRLGNPAGTGSAQPRKIVRCVNPGDQNRSNPPRDRRWRSR